MKNSGLATFSSWTGGIFETSKNVSQPKFGVSLANSAVGIMWYTLFGSRWEVTSMETFASAVSSFMTFVRVAGRLRFRLSDQLEHVGNVLHIFLAGLLGLVAGAQVIIAFRQSQAALIRDRDLLTRVLEILLFAKTEKRVYIDYLKVPHERR